MGSRLASLPWLALLGVLGCAASASTPRPDVLWVVLCTVRADHLGAYGYSVATSPTIDALARSGVLFEDVTAPAPWTRPSIASLLTGIYPRALAIENRTRRRTHRALVDGFETAAERFAAAGYRTVGVTANPNASRTFRFDQGFEAWHDTSRDWSQGYLENLITAEDVVATLNGELQATRPNRPVFAFLVLVDAHGPYPKWERTLDRIGGPLGRGEAGMYDAHIRYADAALADALAGFAAAGRPQPLVVVTSDHGQGFGQGNPADLGHGPHLYRSTLRVPLVFHHPSLSAGRRIAGPVELVDVLPTVLDLAGVAHDPASLDGRSLVEAIRGGAPPGLDRPRVAETAYGYAHRSAIEAGGYKLIVDYGDLDAPPRAPSHELYDLAADPGETRNLAREQPERVAELFARLEQWQRARDRRAPVVPLDVAIQARDDEALRALGYLR